MHLDTVMVLVRYAVLALGSVLVTRGVIQESDVELVIGGISAVLPVVWGVFVRWNTKAVPIGTAKSSPVVSPVTGSVQKS